MFPVTFASAQHRPITPQNPTFSGVHQNPLTPPKDAIHFSGVPKNIPTFSKKDQYTWTISEPFVGNVIIDKQLIVQSIIKGNVESKEGFVRLEEGSQAINVTAGKWATIQGGVPGKVSAINGISIEKGGSASQAESEQSPVIIDGNVFGEAISKKSWVHIRKEGLATHVTAHTFVRLEGKLLGNATLTGTDPSIGAPIFNLTKTAHLGENSRIIFANEDNTTVPGLIVHPDGMKFDRNDDFIKGNYEVISRTEYETRLETFKASNKSQSGT